MYQPRYSEKNVKGEIRSLLLNSLPEPKYKNAVTLPCLNFELENILVERGYKVHTIEQDVQVYEQQLKLPMGKRIYNYYISATEFFVTRYGNRYDFAYLDFCSQITKGMMTSLSHCNATVVGLTVLKARDIYAVELLDTMTRDQYYEHLFYINGYEIIDQVDYMGGTHSPMCTFILTKIQSK